MTAKTTAPTNGAPGQTAEAPASAVAAAGGAALTADAIVAALPNPTAVFAADGPAFTVLAANDALLASAQRPREAIVGRSLAEAFPNASPDDPAASGLAVLRTSLETAVRTGMAQRMPRQRYDLPRPDGAWEVRYWDAVNIPVPGPDGTLSYVLHQTEDVTTQVRSEQATARAERRAERILERMADAHCVLDRAFRFVTVNAAAERVLGVSRAALLGRTHWEAFPASADNDAGRAYRRVAAEGVEQRLTQHYVGEGFDRHLEIDAYPTDEGGVAVFWRDVTERVRAERERDRLLTELGAERERLRSLILQMPVPLALLEGPEHTFALANDAYRRVSGARADVVGRPLREAFPELAGQGLYERFDAVAATGVPWIVTETLVRYDRDGTGVQDAWIHLRLEPVRDGDGRVVGILNFNVDVTDQVRARQEVERLLAAAEHARGEAAAANQAKSGFLATMSHELRTPVNAVIGYAQILDMGLAGPLSEQQRDYLARLARSSHHLLGLVNDVLDLSKIEAGETRVAHIDGTTGPAVGAALDVVAPAAAARGVRLVDARTDEAGVPFVGDEDRVRQVAVNLLSNAIKFTAPGGTVTVTSDTVIAAPPAATSLKGEGPWALVRVVDTGVGIAPEEQGRIFEPFHQVDGGHTRTAGGTGLGLPISRRLARLMGGDLSVESAPGEGSVFTLWLPAARHEVGHLNETAPARTARAERDLTRLETPALGEVGALLHEAVTQVIGAYTDRLRADPAIPLGSAMTRIQLEDHAISFLADLAQSLVIVGDAGPEAVELLKDGSAIQRTISEAHGARRYAQGWNEAALRRDQEVFREEVERAVRAGLKRGSADVAAAVHVLLGLIERGQEIAVRAWRRAAQDASS